MFQTGYPTQLFTELSIEFEETVFAVVLKILDYKTKNDDTLRHLVGLVWYLTITVTPLANY